MPRYALTIQYDGTRYVGYQVQPNGLTIQACLEQAIAKMAKLSANERIVTVASGRTDSGVHALGQVVHFDYISPINEQALQRALNSLLPDDIQVVSAEKVEDDFHARYNVVAKRYRYRVSTEQFVDPFKRLYTLHHPYRYQLFRMEEAIQCILGTHDFTSFCSTKTDKENKVRTIYEATVIEDEQTKELIFEFVGDGFLYNMIRILVGTLLQIGDGLREPRDMQTILDARNRTQAGPTAPPQGLYLAEVYYDAKKNKKKPKK